MCTRSLGGLKLTQHGVRAKVVARDRAVADLAEAREVHFAPIDLADLGKASRDRQIKGPHGELQAHILLTEVATIVVVAEKDHRPCPEEEVAAMVTTISPFS